MLARLVIGLAVGFGCAAALVDAVSAEGGRLVLLTEAEQSAVVGQLFTASECVRLNTGCPTTPAGAFGAPCTNPGGLCSIPGSVYCADSTKDWACTPPYNTFNPFDWNCVWLPNHPCHSDVLECIGAGGTGTCQPTGNNKGPNPTKCGTVTQCKH